MTTAHDPPTGAAAPLASLLRRDAAALAALVQQLGLTVKPQAERAELLAALFAHHIERGDRPVVGGVLELLPEGFGFLRFPTHDFDSGPADVYVSPSQVRGLNLKSGQHVAGTIRAPKGTERYFALLHVDAVDGEPPEQVRTRLPFRSRTPVLPRRPLSLGGATSSATLLGDLAPWYRGHRVLWEAPAGWPAATGFAALANAMATADPSLQLVLLLLDQRPEDAAAARRQVGERAEVLATHFDTPPDRQLTVADLVLVHAMRSVEVGRDVVLLCDGLTTLTRLRQREQPPSGRWLCPGLDAMALQPAHRLFAAARACAEGGSLTVVASLRTGANQTVDEAMAAEFRARASSVVAIDPARLAAGSPAPFDLQQTRTRPEDDDRSQAERAAAEQRRQHLAALAPADRDAAVLAAGPEAGAGDR
jgi:transcription termination factor Rho